MSETAFPKIALVDAPAASANVRMDLNSTFGSATCITTSTGFSLGTPTLEVEPGAVGGTYGVRSITLTPRIEGPKPAALSLLNTLARELLRWDNWLLVQLNAFTKPVWFHLYQSQPGALSLDEVYVEGDLVEDAWETSLTFTADAFALGERITLPTMTFAQTPTGFSQALPAINGDASSPLRIRVEQLGSKAASGYGSRWLLACLSGDNPAPTVVDIGPSDGFTVKSGTDAGSTNANYFGNGYRTVTIGTGSNYVDRLTGSLSVAPGRYKVLLRATATQPSKDHTVPFLFSLGQYPDTNTTFPPTYGATATQSVGSDLVGSAAAKTFMGCVDLGDFSFPFNAPTLPRDVATSSQPNSFVLRVGTGDQTAGTVRLDSLILIPLSQPQVQDASILQVGYGNAITPKYVVPLTAGTVGTFDSAEGITWLTNTAGTTVFAGGAVLAGGFPAADPAQAANRLYVIAMDQGFIDGTDVDWTTSLGAQAMVTVSHQPQILHLPRRP